jgi:hypothetical protein
MSSESKIFPRKQRRGGRDFATEAYVSTSQGSKVEGQRSICFCGKILEVTEGLTGGPSEPLKNVIKQLDCIRAAKTNTYVH